MTFFPDMSKQLREAAVHDCHKFGINPKKKPHCLLLPKDQTDGFFHGDWYWWEKKQILIERGYDPHKLPSHMDNRLQGQWEMRNFNLRHEHHIKIRPHRHGYALK